MPNLNLLYNLNIRDLFSVFCYNLIMNKLKIFFITGTNSAGKSTIVPILRRNLSDKFIVYDFDEVGVPKNVDAKWRQQTTNYWLEYLHLILQY